MNDVQSKGSSSDGLPVVGIGASAGGLSAIKVFFENMPAKSGMAFVVVIHLSPKYESSADKILQRSTRMPVTQVTKSIRIEPDNVYVISPRHELRMIDGSLEVSDAEGRHGPHVAIDIFFRTLAEARRDRAIGIVLSGTGSDGTLGAARLKETGGVTLAQLPEDSEYEDMPRNAIGSGHVDFVLPVAEMPQKLVDLWENARAIRLPEPLPDDPPVSSKSTDDPAAEAALHEIVKMLAQRTGHDFTYYKRATILRRMERRMQVRLLRDLPAYCAFLRDNPDETPLLLADMLISVTNFFRDRESFDALEREVVPALFSEPSNQQVRCWVPGCATGEEAYSIAMLLSEESQRHHDKPFQIFASDIDTSAIAVARRGVYPESIVTDVSPGRLRAFFTHKDHAYRLRKELRDRVLFAAHNMLRDPPFSQLDLISCRNVLIYLNRDIQAKLLEMFHFALKPEGRLFLGSSESADVAGSLFRVVDKKHRIFAPPSPSLARARTPVLPLRIELKPLAGSSPAPDAHPATASDIHQRVLEEYAPPSVIVDTRADIVHMSEKAGRYLRHKAGVPSHNLLNLVLPPLRPELRSAMLQAEHTGKSVEARRVKLAIEGKQVYVNLIARPFKDASLTQTYMLVIFQEVDEALGEQETGTSASPPGLVAQLEGQLTTTKEMLQATIEASDTSNEELKASNEELQAINEELRSASEELETSKEELQSVNEELITVNAELKFRIEETSKANDDLTNFISASDIATIFVDADLCIRRYTPRAELIFSLIPSDVGRSLMDISHRLDYPGLLEDVSSVLGERQLIEREVASVDGRLFIARLRPYHRAGKDVEGVVLTFFDVTSLRIAERRVRRSDEELRKALASSLEYGVITTDDDGLVVSWNSGAEAIFGYAGTEMVGSPLEAIFVPEDVAAGVAAIERETARTSGRAEDNRWHQRKDGTRVFCRGVMTPLSHGRNTGFAKIVRDATEEQLSDSARERQLQLARAGRADAEAHAALKDDFLAVMSHELKHPLNLINVNAAIIGRVLDPDASGAVPIANALGTITRAVRAQSRIIDDLLDLSRIRTGKLALDLAPVDLVAVAESATEMLRADTAAMHLEIDFEHDQPSVNVHADPTRLNQIVWNLLNNAVKFTPPGGRISVRVYAEEECGCLQVIDSGQGIDADSLSNIFEMFGQARARAASRQSGLGIGLALVRQLAVAHGGRVEAQSDGPGKGARFTLWLPLDTDPKDPVAGLLEDRRASRCAGLSLLVVDDDHVTVDALKTLLSLEGAQVSSATSGAEALRIASAQEFDLVITDLGMAGMDGYELLAQLKAAPRTAQWPVIALTGFGREKDVLLAELAGFSAHISKPVSIERLLALIGRLTSGNRDKPELDS
jgi:two-component system, chemotaxis family, CheB/CheR fusion protein